MENKGRILEKVELVGKYNWNLIKRYFKHIQEVTGRVIGQNQIEKLKEALRVKEYKKLSPEDYAKHIKEYTSTRRAKMIKEWENNTGQKWPVDEKGVSMFTIDELKSLEELHILVNDKRIIIKSANW